MEKERPSRRKRLLQILQELYQNPAIEGIYLVNDEGLYVASAASHAALDADAFAGLVARLWYSVRLLRREIGWAAMDEIVMRADSRRHLVIRSVPVGHQTLFLIALVAPGRPHRRLMNRAARAIQRVWAVR